VNRPGERPTLNVGGISRCPGKEKGGFPVFKKRGERIWENLKEGRTGYFRLEKRERRRGCQFLWRGTKGEQWFAGRGGKVKTRKKISFDVRVWAAIQGERIQADGVTWCQSRVFVDERESSRMGDGGGRPRSRRG